MAIYEHCSEFAGKQVQLWNIGDAVLDLSTTIPRIAVEYEEGELPDVFKALLEAHDSSQLTGLVIGAWQEVWEPDGEQAKTMVKLLVKHSKALSNLTALFWGDIISEESEISWIGNTDISSLWDAFPKLEHLRIRGGNNLSVAGLDKLTNLKELIIETGGIGQDVVQQVAQAKLAKLEKLDIYLGMEDYGADYSLEDLQPIFSGENLPKLCYLGLQNSEMQDEIAQALADSAIVAQLETLDVSHGTLSDAGAQALLDSQAISKLASLIIIYHYCSPEMVAKLEAHDNITVDEAQEEDAYDDEVYRYVAIGE